MQLATVGLVVCSLAAHATTYPYPCPCHYDQRAFVYRIRMPLDDLAGGHYLFRNRHVNEAYNARMWQATDKHQLTEVLVFGDKRPLLVIC